MTTTMSRWFVPIVGLVLGVLISAAALGRNATPGRGRDLVRRSSRAMRSALRALQSRSDVASLLSGLPDDERWASINLRALSLAGQVIAVVLVAAFLVASFSGGDALAYAWVGAVFAVAYLGGLVWYRSRS